MVKNRACSSNMHSTTPLIYSLNCQFYQLHSVVGKWVPAAAGKAKAGMSHSNCGWTCGCAGKTVKSIENTCHTWALLRWWFSTKRHYIKCMHLYLLHDKLLGRILELRKYCLVQHWWTELFANVLIHDQHFEVMAENRRYVIIIAQLFSYKNMHFLEQNLVCQFVF